MPNIEWLWQGRVILELTEIGVLADRLAQHPTVQSNPKLLAPVQSIRRASRNGAALGIRVWRPLDTLSDLEPQHKPAA